MAEKEPPASPPNPPAHPLEWSTFEYNRDSSKTRIYHRQHGMTLLDYFAGQALAGLLAAPSDATSQNIGPSARADHQLAASVAYLMARAMLRERALEVPA